MSRIRSIHPGIWTDDAFMSLSAHARLLFIGVWNEAWDDGVFEWKPLTLKARIFPVDGVDVSALLDELVKADCVVRFEGEKTIGVIRNFRLYQRPKKPNSSGLMPPELEQYAGLVRNQLPTDPEKSQQMEDGGGSKEEGQKEPIAQHTVPAAPRSRWDELQDQLLAAAGLAGFRDERNPKLANLAPIRGLMEQGYSLEADILPAIRDKAAEGVVMQSWAYIVPVVVERAAAKKSIPPKPIPQQEDWHKRMAVWNESQTWAPAWGPKPNEPGCKAPAELLRAA